MVNSLPNGKILGLSKFTAFADHKSINQQLLVFVSESLENIVRKGENAGHQAFSPFPTMF